MKNKLIFMFIVFMSSAILLACQKSEGDVKSDIDTKEDNIKNENTTNDSIKPLENNEEIEKIVEYLEELQVDKSISYIEFYEDEMYVLLSHDKKYEIIQYNMNTYTSKATSVDIGEHGIYRLKIDDTKIQIPTVGKDFYLDNSIYIYDKNLELQRFYEGLSKEYCVANNGLYYYNNEKSALCFIDDSTNEEKVIRQLGTFEKEKACFVEEIYISKSQDYIFYTGNYSVDGLGANDNCWGYFDLNDENKDILKSGLKIIENTKNGIFIFDHYDDYSFQDISTLTNEFYKYEDSNYKTLLLENATESPHTGVSYEGNILYSYEISKELGDNYNLRIYDLKEDKIVLKIPAYAGALYNWSICEKYRFVLDISDIHELTGKVKLIWKAF